MGGRFLTPILLVMIVGMVAAGLYWRELSVMLGMPRPGQVEVAGLPEGEPVPLSRLSPDLIGASSLQSGNVARMLDERTVDGGRIVMLRLAYAKAGLLAEKPTDAFTKQRLERLESQTCRQIKAAFASKCQVFPGTGLVRIAEDNEGGRYLFAEMDLMFAPSLKGQVVRPNSAYDYRSAREEIKIEATGTGKFPTQDEAIQAGLGFVREKCAEISARHGNCGVRELLIAGDVYGGIRIRADLNWIESR